MTDRQTCNCWRWFHSILHKHFDWVNTTISTGLGKHLHHKIIVNPKIKFDFKGILVFFLPFLIFLQQLWQTKRKQQVNGVRRRKGVSLQISEFPNNTNNSPLLQQTLFMSHMHSVISKSIWQDFKRFFKQKIIYCYSLWTSPEYRKYVRYSKY